MHFGRERKVAEREVRAETVIAEMWSGRGTALKPAFEPVVMARKPLAGTVAATVIEHGTGALNVRIERNGTGDLRRLETYRSPTPQNPPETIVHGAGGSSTLSRRSSTPGRFENAPEYRAASLKPSERYRRSPGSLVERTLSQTRVPFPNAALLRAA